MARLRTDTTSAPTLGGGRRIRGTNEVRLISFGSAILAAVLVLTLAPAWLAGVARLVAAYDAAASVLIALLWRLAMHTDADRTRARAALDDPGRNLVFLTVMLAGLIGLVSAVTVLGATPHALTKSEHGVAVVLALLAVVSGWTLIHTTFTLRYAHLFYHDSDGDNRGDGGLKFPGGGDPSDYDFAYFSFVVGMTFQVSDVEVEDAGIRRLVLGHGLISFAFNSAIVALVVNIASGLISK